MNNSEVRPVFKEGTSVLVTGATGILGPVLVHRLLQMGLKVRVLLRPGANSSSLPDKVESITGDLNESNSLERAVQNIDIVFHLAAKLHIYGPCRELEQEYNKVNVLGTKKLLLAARGAGVKRLIYFSTINIYGVSNIGQILDEESLPNPQTLYAKTKLGAEKEVLKTKSIFSDQSLGVVLRLGAVYGSGMKGNYLKMLKGLHQRWFLPIGPAQNRRALIYIDDAIQAALIASVHPAAAGNVYNLTDGKIYTLLDIIQAMCEALDRRKPGFHIPVSIIRVCVSFFESLFDLFNRKFPIGQDMVDAMLEDRAVSGEKIQQEIGFRPRIVLEDGWKIIVDEVIKINQ